jgi:carboxypeptidase family protein/TonB-dependent receptor-like protein
MKRRSLLFGLALLFVSLSLAAQDNASLTGTVKDSSGASVPNATVVVTDTEKGVTRQLTSNTDGEYLAGGLPAGVYSIQVSAAGFKKYEAKDITLRVAQKARVDIALEVGAVSNEVTVQGEGLAQVDTQSSELAGTVDSKELSKLQLNGRNFTQLVTLVPGVNNQTGQDEGQVGVNGNVEYSINGGRGEYNNWELDGGDNMDNGSNSTLNVYPSLDAIAEVRVLTGNYGAQYGRNASGTIEVETKSGTNQFHGMVYEYLRNNAFNARNYFLDSSQPTPGYKKNDFGYNFGGPIKKDKLYFFWSQEWRRDRVPGQVFNQAVPSNENRAGNFNDVCNNPNGVTDCPIDPSTGQPFPNNTVPIDPNSAALLAMIPAANAGSGVSSFFNAAPSQPTNWREELARGDWNITQKHRATFRYIHDSWSTVTPTVLPWGAVSSSFPTIQTQFSGPGVSMVAKLVSTFSPTLLNEFVASYTTDKISLSNTGPWARPSSFTAGQLFPDNGGKLPGVSIATNGEYQSGFAEDPSFIPQGKYNSNPTYTLRDNVTKNMGKHNLQFGAYFVAAQKNELSSGQNNGLLSFDSTAPNSTGNAFADLLMGNIANFTQASAQPKYYNRYKIFEPYLQDDWHVSNKLTLNLGLRVSLFGTYREKEHQAYNFEPAAWDPANAPQIDSNGFLVAGTGSPTNGMVQCGVGGAPPGCQTGHLFNPAPRIGFAYDPFGDGKTSIRAAYGIFYEHTNGNEGNSESLENSPPLVLTPTQYTINGYNNIGGGTNLLNPLGVTAIPTKAVWPYMQQWHLDIQRDLFRNTVATISYVGTKGTHLTLQRDLNQLYPVAASQNPFQRGQPITGDICDSSQTNADNSFSLPNGGSVAPGNPIYGNLVAACGFDPNSYRTNFPGYGTITSIEPTANSNYNALQISARRTQGRLSLSLAYTWSHSLDDASDRYDSNFVNSYDTHANYASSNFDQRHVLTASWVYDIPFFNVTGWKQSVLGGWQYSGIFVAQSGTPFSVVDGVYSDSAGLGNGTSTGSFADLVGNPHQISGPIYDPTVKGPLLFNPDAFAETTGLTQGNSGRNLLNNPGRWNFDMAMYKNFKLNERFNLEFRTEAYNIFNHTQWTAGSIAAGGGVQNSLGGADNFLRPTAAHDPRILQFALKLGF